MTWNTLHPDVRATAEQALTPLQLQVLQHRLDGHSWRTIARALNRNEATIRGHHRAALDRLAPHIDQLRKAAA